MLHIKYTNLLLLIFIVAITSCDAQSSNSHLYSACIEAPPLPIASSKVVTVGNVDQLYEAVYRAEADSTILIKPGRYRLGSSTFGITKDNVTIRGLQDNCSSVELIGPGMDNRNRNNVDSGFWIKGNNATIANMTISDVYFHSIQIDSSSSAPHIYNVRMINAGQQFVKANPSEFGQGVNDGIVEYSIMEYTDGPPVTDHNGIGTGYTQGVDIHAGNGWRISNNLFKNFHTPDNAEHLWNAAVLAWNGASNTVTENNTFIDVDRAIAYGLDNKDFDHRGGIIRNNMVFISPGLYSASRTQKADATIVVWDSPGTKVLHNTVLTNGNTPLSIEVRFETVNIEVSNNATDAPIRHRDNKYFVQNDNVEVAQPNWFVDPVSGNLRLKSEIEPVVNKVTKHQFAQFDIDGEPRPSDSNVDIGADEHHFIPTYSE